MHASLYILCVIYISSVHRFTNTCTYTYIHVYYVPAYYTCMSHEYVYDNANDGTSQVVCLLVCHLGIEFLEVW